MNFPTKNLTTTEVKIYQKSISAKRSFFLNQLESADYKSGENYKLTIGNVHSKTLRLQNIMKCIAWVYTRTLV